MKFRVRLGENSNEVVVSQSSPTEFQIELNGRICPVTVLFSKGEQLVLSLGDHIVDLVVWGQDTVRYVAQNDQVFHLKIEDPKRILRQESEGTSEDKSCYVKALMPGKIVAVLKKKGEEVQKGEGLVIIESMKMQNELESPKLGTVTICNVKLGASVEKGQLLFQIE